MCGGKDIEDITATKYMSIKQEGYIEGRAFEKEKAKEFITNNCISKDKIKNRILKYRCFGWHNKDDEYWANRILDGFEELLEE